jgi:hypothetical protein
MTTALNGPAVTPPYAGLVLTDPRIGCVMNSNTDQGAKIQLALDLAGASQKDACVIVPPGYIICRQQLEWPITRAVHLCGGGLGDQQVTSVSTIYFDTDLGAGSYALDLNLTPYPYQITDLAFIGPGASISSTNQGSQVAQMDGIKCNTRGFMQNLRVAAFNSGFYVQNDHQEWRSCNLAGNTYAMNFGENGVGGTGDLVIDRCYLTNCTRASIAVSSTNALANALFTQGHAGACPFGIWRYPSPGTACVGSVGAGATLTNVAMDWSTPQDGMILEGTNIPGGTTLLSHSGTLGNYTFVMSNAATGPVSSVVIARRGVALVGCQFIQWSWEGCGNAVIYDDYGVQSGNWGSFTNLYFTTADSSTFSSQFGPWRQQNVAATGANTSTTISGVAITAFTPTKGMAVTGTNVGTNAKITAVSGSSGNWTLTVDQANTGTVTTVTVGQPTDLAVYEVGGCLGWTFSNGTPCPGYTNHPAIRANSIRHVHFDDADGIRNNIFDNPTTVRPFAVRTAYSSSAIDCEDLTFGGPKDTGGLRMAALVTDDALAIGELVEPSNYAHVRKSLATSIPLGHAIGTWTQGEVAVFVTSTPSHANTKVKNTSGSTINNNDLIKPHTSGGIKTATSITDVPVIGQARETITNGSLGQVWARY